MGGRQIMSTNIIFAGVGGQGVLLVSRILGNVLLRQNYDFKSFEVHGMSQRGGAVAVHVRFGENVFSPFIEEGTADYLVAFEQLEALRNLSFVKPGGKIITCTQQVQTVATQIGKERYPNDCIAMLQMSNAEVTVLDAIEIAKKCGDEKTLNMALLGFLGRELGLLEKDFYYAIDLFVKEKYKDVNKCALTTGYCMKI